MLLLLVVIFIEAEKVINVKMCPGFIKLVKIILCPY